MSNVSIFESKLFQLYSEYEYLVDRPNTRKRLGSGVLDRYLHPVLTTGHVPIHWQYDLDAQSNPYMMVRLGINSIASAGAILHDGKVVLATGLEGNDHHNFFAIAESRSGYERFRFRDSPVAIPAGREQSYADVFHLRLTRHADGWIYGLFSLSRESNPHLVSGCGVIRTRDLVKWERLPDLNFSPGSAHHFVLHPELVDSHYLIYATLFSDAGPTSGGVFQFLLDDWTAFDPSMGQPFAEPTLPTRRSNLLGLCAAPILTPEGWLHMGLSTYPTVTSRKFTLVPFLTEREAPFRILYRPGSYLLAPEGSERMGDAPNWLFSNGWVKMENGQVLIYFNTASSRLQVAGTSIAQLLDFVKNTPSDVQSCQESVARRRHLIEQNKPRLAQIHL